MIDTKTAGCYIQFVQLIRPENSIFRQLIHFVNIHSDPWV